MKEQKKHMKMKDMVTMGTIGMMMTGRSMRSETTNGNDLRDEAKVTRKAKEKDVANPRAKKRRRERPRDHTIGGGGNLRESQSKS